VGSKKGNILGVFLFNEYSQKLNNFKKLIALEMPTVYNRKKFYPIGWKKKRPK
jgi:hypothetical protein